MLRGIENLYGWTLAALDGDIGTVDQVYFDDEAWGVRYLVVNTGSWMEKRQVLISPYSIKRLDSGSGTVHVDLTRQQVKESPDVNADKPVSRQHECRYIGYFGYPKYWGGTYLWGVDAYPATAVIAAAKSNASEATGRNDPDADNLVADVHLRSTKEVKGYHINATGGSIGRVSGFIFDDVSWAIRYLTVDTRNWWPGGKEVLIATRWIDLVEWAGSTVYTRLTRDAIKNSPEYDGSLPLSRRYEETLHKYYDKDGYWSDDEPDMEVFEKVGTREFSAVLKLDAGVILKEGARELTGTTLNSALPALAKYRNGPAILESTIAELLRALIREHARVT